MSPVFAMVIQSLPEHPHDQAVRLDVVCVLRELTHQGTTGTPGVIGGRLTNFGLRIRVVVYNVLSVVYAWHCIYEFVHNVHVCTIVSRASAHSRESPHTLCFIGLM